MSDWATTPRTTVGRAQPQAGAESRTQGHVPHRSRDRAHPGMLTVAIRGPLASKMRALAETTSMSLAKLLSDMVLVYEGEVRGEYEPGTSLARWREIGGVEAWVSYRTRFPRPPHDRCTRAYMVSGGSG